VLQQSSRQHAELAERLAGAMAGSTDALQQASAALSHCAQATQSHVDSVTPSLARLNQLLGELGDRQIILEDHRPRRRRWFAGKRGGDGAGHA